MLVNLRARSPAHFPVWRFRGRRVPSARAPRGGTAAKPERDAAAPTGRDSRVCRCECDERRERAILFPKPVINNGRGLTKLGPAGRSGRRSRALPKPAQPSRFFLDQEISAPTSA
ncbi:hypothetical protein NL676_031171 [Syzygium grande]|nr:hypothetical protein NL676_031171 [Syzygium grande]